MTSGKKDDANMSVYSSVLGDREKKKSKTKCCVCSALGLLVVGGIIAIIVVVVGNNKDDDNGGGNKPTPDPENNDPLLFQEYNPFIIDPDSPIESQDWYFNGVLENNQQSDSQMRKLSTAEFLKEKNQVYNKLQPDAKSVRGDNKLSYRPVDPKDIASGDNNKVPQKVNFNFSLVNNYEARVQLTNNEGQNYSVTDRTYHRIVQEFEARFTQLGFEHSNAGEPFYWSLTNIFDGQEILTTRNRKFLVQEKFSEIGMVLPNNRLFGLGLSNRQFRLDTDATYTLWSKGRQNDPLEEDIGLGGYQGAQPLPFILGQTQDKGDWFGLFFVGGEASSFEIISVPDKDNVILNYITLGDQIEFYVIMRGTAKQIIQKYQHQLGFPSLPPYYALGIFTGSQVDAAWADPAQIQTKIDSYIAANMPIEGVVIDQYTPQNFCPFQVSSSFDLDTMQTYLKGKDMKMYLSIQAGIQTPGDYICEAYTLATGKCLLMQNGTTNETIGISKPFASEDGADLYGMALIDVFNTDAANECMNELFANLNETKTVMPDGIYLRDNTPFTISNGSNLEMSSYENETEKVTKVQAQVPEKAKEQNKDQVFANFMSRLGDPPNPEDVGEYTGYSLNANQSEINYNNLPFVPGYANGGNMSDRTIDNNIMHQGFEDTVPSHEDGVPHLYVHEQYGLTQHNLTYNYLRNMSDQRPNIYSQSVWPSSGFLGGSFSQPLEISWASVKNSISMAMMMGLNGFNHWVTDVCGIDMAATQMLNQTEIEICARWMEVSAFLPMVNVKSRLLDLVETAPTTTYYGFIDAMAQRGPFTRYIYSQMFASNYTGGQLVYPLLYDFPEDDMALENIEQTYMLGEAIKVSPVLTAQDGESDTTFDSYFPEGMWRDLNDWTSVINTMDGGKMVALNRTTGQTQIHLKSGKVIPWQAVEKNVRTLTTDLMKQPTTLIINVDDSNYADGFMMIDDGTSQTSFATNYYTFWKFRYGEKALNFWVERGNFTYDVSQEVNGAQFQNLDKVVILGAAEQFPSIAADIDNYAACSFGIKLDPEAMDIAYNADQDTLEITPTNRKTFAELGFIKFLDKTSEPNVCDSTGFQYTAKLDEENSTSTQQIYALTPATTMPDQFKNLTAVFTLMADDGTINFNMTTTEDYEADYQKIFRAWHVQDYSQYFNLSAVTADISTFLSVQESPFQFTIIDKDQNAVYTSESNKLYMTEFLVFDSGTFPMNSFNENPLIGMGERAGDLFYKNEDGGVHSRWTHDAANPIDDGLPPGRNMYGIQPFYIYQGSNLNWYGVFNNNPYATDFIVTTPKADGDNQTAGIVTTVTIGGAIEKYFFAGAKVDDIIIKYEKLTGMPMMPPMWAFGWQQCRFGYVTDELWYNVTQQYDTYKIPIDTMWADIDYMDDYKVFSISPSRYSNLTKWVKEIRETKNMTFVPIMDAGVAVREDVDNYYTLKTGLDKGVFIKQALSDEPLTGGVWCGNAYFPDFFNQVTNDWWHDNWDYLHKTLGLEVDGIWLDMNEATSFCDGYCIESERPKSSLRNKAYYIPGQRDLETQNLGVDGRHDNSTKEYRIAEYDAHNTFSIMQTKASHSWLEKQGKRPYVLSRSNFQGLQKYAYHWLGDNWSWVQYMADSVKNIYEYQLFGLPFMGCDLCGFNGDAVADLCARWHQVGTLFPFARNHNQNATTSQEPYVFNYTLMSNVSDNTDLTYTDLIRTAIKNRYTLIRYFYSQFWAVNEYGGSFFKPLFFEFGSDPEAYKLIEKNMLVGNALKASVETTNLTKLDEVDFYFPEGTWCQLVPTIQQNFSECFDMSAGGQNMSLRSHMEDYYVHLRNGYIVPAQNASVHDTMRTPDQLNQFTDLLILPNAANSDTKLRNETSVDAAAFGYIYLDDGVSLQKNVTIFDFYYQFGGSGTGATETEANLMFDKSGDNYTNPLAINEMLGNITIFNPMRDPAPDRASDPPVDARTVASVKATVAMNSTAEPTEVTLDYMYDVDNDANSQVLQIVVSDASKDMYRFDQIQKITITYNAPS